MMFTGIIPTVLNLLERLLHFANFEVLKENAPLCYILNRKESFGISTPLNFARPPYLALGLLWCCGATEKTEW
jgi:hypothetical protein